MLKTFFHSARERVPRSEKNAGRCFGGGERVREFEEREWVSACFGKEALAYGSVEAARDHGVEQYACVGGCEPVELEGGKACEVFEVFAACDRERDRVGGQAASDESERPRRLGIEPLCVVDDAQEWLRGSCLGQEAEGGEPDEVAVRGLARAQSECDSQRFALWCRQHVDRVEHQPAQLLQTCVREVDLALDTGCPGDPKP
jgi:hypothetical protein